MAERALAEGPEPETSQLETAKAVAEHAGAALKAGVAPGSPAALAVVERLEAMADGSQQDRATAAERIEAFNDRRVARYWTLVAIVNDWPAPQQQATDDLANAWDWYARALRAHA